MTKEERELHQSDVKAKSDLNASIRYAAKKAKAEGRHEEAVEIAIRLKKKGMLIEDIQEITNLSTEVNIKYFSFSDQMDRLLFIILNQQLLIDRHNGQ